VRHGHAEPLAQRERGGQLLAPADLVGHHQQVVVDVVDDELDAEAVLKEIVQRGSVQLPPHARRLESEGQRELVVVLALPPQAEQRAVLATHRHLLVRSLHVELDEEAAGA